MNRPTPYPAPPTGRAVRTRMATRFRRPEPPPEPEPEPDVLALAVEYAIQELGVPEDDHELIMELARRGLAPKPTVAAVVSGYDQSHKVIQTRQRKRGLPNLGDWLRLGCVAVLCDRYRSEQSMDRAIQGMRWRDRAQAVCFLRQQLDAGTEEIRAAPEPVWRWAVDRWMERAR